MTLRCRPGDLAVIVRSRFGNEGAIVQCVTLFPQYKGRDDFYHAAVWGVRCATRLKRPSWTKNDDEWCKSRGFDNVVRDIDLRPIRPSDGTDEMLLIAGKPTEEVMQ